MDEKKKKRKREVAEDEGEADVAGGVYGEEFDRPEKAPKPEKMKKKKGKKMSAMSPAELADFNAKAANRCVCDVDYGSVHILLLGACSSGCSTPPSRCL